MGAAAGNQEEWDDPKADFAARLAHAAYGVALNHGVRGSFAELELAMWRAVSAVIAAESACERMCEAA